MANEETIEGLRKAYEDAKEKNAEVCPNCGYCPHCGRRNAAPYVPMPVYPWYPTYPQYPYGPIWYALTNATGLVQGTGTP